MQGATELGVSFYDSEGFQSTPPMQGATFLRDYGIDLETVVSIHAPYAGSDLDLRSYVFRHLMFQSTPPMQGATCIHVQKVTLYTRFNPRPLCRERRTSGITIRAITAFQSTPPMQGATEPGDQRGVRHTSFNPRPLCRERHSYRSAWANAAYGFNPRPLCRERL